jgi:potassium/hydrogen antiporter
MDELTAFGGTVLLVGLGVSLALLTMKVTHRVQVPAPALFLVAAAVLSDVFPGLADAVSTETVARIGVVALIVILLDGGMHVGWQRFRRSAVPIAVLGVLGTFATAAVMAFFAHVLFDFDWVTAGIIGAALAPTDPAVMFSVLGNREVEGRTGTILEGESGANDPVGIALMIGLLELATHDDASFAIVVEEFALEMAVGLGLGLVGAGLLTLLMRRVVLPSAALYPLGVLALAGVVYGTAAVLHGSGFLAVFIAGLLIGDARTRYQNEVESFHSSLASLAEIAVFIALGLTIDLGQVFGDGHWLDGLVFALLLAFLARPLVAGLLLLKARLRWGERLFVMWGGLKGAVPILLAAFAVIAAIDEAERIYGIVFVVVMFSVLVQGTSIGPVAARLGIPMRLIEPEPLDRSGTMTR